MTALDQEVSHLRDAAAMFQAFQVSSWRRLSLSAGALHLDFSREVGEASRGSLARNPVAGGLTVRKTELLTSVQLGTLQMCAAVGQTVAARAPYAILNVLDDVVELTAGRMFEVFEVFCAPGDLIEFGAPILRVDNLD